MTRPMATDTPIQTSTATAPAVKQLTIIMPIPNHDFDPTEVAVTWKIVRDAGHAVEFATPDGTRGYADPMMISGKGLDPWGWIPGVNQLRFIGLFLRADRFGRRAYRQLERDPRFLQPKRYDALRVDDYDAMVLPGGHAQRVKPYLESPTLQRFVADFFDARNTAGKSKPVAAICHGVVLAARSVSNITGKSALHGRKTTALTWKLESGAWQLTKYLGRFWDPGYYRTYRESNNEPAGYRSVEQEIKRALATETDFIDVPENAGNHFRKTSGLVRDRIDDPRPAWVVRDSNYISARWPGDVHTFAQRFVQMLSEQGAEN